jgi:hypothetical protein
MGGALVSEPFSTSPAPGFYATKFVRGGIDVPVMVWFGAPIIKGERQDRSPRWCIAIDGRSCRIDQEQQCRVPLDALDYWPLKRRITAVEYIFMRRRARWAREHQPDHPAANPFKPIDLDTMAPRF